MVKAPVKKTSVKQATAKKAVSKQSAAKSAAPKNKPVKEALSKSSLIDLIAEKNDLPRATAKRALATIEDVMIGSIHPRGVGEFTLPGLLKISLNKVPARKAGTLVRNPATGQMVPGAAKPASMRIKIRALSKLKAATVS